VKPFNNAKYFCRYLKERGSFNLAKPLLTRALALAEQRPENLQVLRADLLFSLGSLAGESNDAKAHLFYARQHLDARLESGLQDKDLGMGYAELSVSLSNNGMYEDALEAGKKSLDIYQQTEDYLNGSYWPHYAIIHQALALLAMNRGKEAINMLEDTLSWRVKQYGANNTESFK
jgi:tetratricopeptide (TPR) repeat protein